MYKRVKKIGNDTKKGLSTVFRVARKSSYDKKKKKVGDLQEENQELRSQLAQKEAPSKLNLNSNTEQIDQQRERERESNLTVSTSQTETQWIDTPTPSAEKSFTFNFSSPSEQTTPQKLDKPNKAVNLTTFSEQASQTEPFNLQLPEIAQKNQQIQQKEQKIAELAAQLTQQQTTQQEFKSLQREYDYLQEISQWRISQHQQ